MMDIARKQRQFLVHSFIYYKLNDSLITDEAYDKLCKDLYNLQQQSLEGPYDTLCKPLDSSGSGYYILEYPPEIESVGLRMLWYQKYKTIKGFEDFLAENNYEVIYCYDEG